MAKFRRGQKYWIEKRDNKYLFFSKAMSFERLYGLCRFQKLMKVKQMKGIGGEGGWRGVGEECKHKGFCPICGRGHDSS